MTEIETERRGRVALHRINRPEKKNAFTRDMYASLADAIRAADAEDEVRVHLIVGSGGDFSAGNDMADFAAFGEAGADDEGGNTEVFDLMEVVIRARKPIVSAATGFNVGIGTTLHLNCDLTVAAEDAVFLTPFVDLGITPEFGSSRSVPERFGHQRAFAMLGLCEPLDGRAAQRMGLVWKAVPSGEVEAEAMALAERLAQKPPTALQMTRDLLLGDRDERVAICLAEGKLFRERLRSAESRAAVQAFLQSRRKKA